MTSRSRHADTRLMTKFVIAPDAATRLAANRAAIGAEHQVLAPTLLSLLYEAVGRGDLTKQEAELRLDHVRGLRLRLLGDRVLRGVA